MSFHVVIFGETGTGKTSLINMIAGANGDTSSGAKGCTLDSTPYTASFGGLSCTLHDTAGLNEGDQGQVLHSDAIVRLYKLLRKLEDGVGLLILVLKAPPRIKDSTTSNWKLFRDIMCKKQVPTAIVVTGLELEEDMDGWWPKNKSTFFKYSMLPDDYACVTTQKGIIKRGAHVFQEEYDASKKAVQDMIRRRSSLSTPWRMERIEWMNQIIYNTVVESRKGRSPVEKQVYSHTIYGASRRLVQECGMSEAEAEQLSKALDATEG